MKYFLKRILIVVVCIAIVSAMLVGCGSSSKSSKRSKSSRSSSASSSSSRSSKDSSSLSDENNESDEDSESTREKASVRNSKKTLSPEEYEARWSMHDVPVTEVDERWGIKTFNPSEDTITEELEKSAFALYDAYVEEMERLKREEVIQAEEDLYAKQKLYWDSVAEYINDILYSGLTGAMMQAQSKIIYGEGSDSLSGSYDSNCAHKWVATYYHRVGTTTTNTESIDGYTTKEDSSTTCAWLACYECSKCGSIKSYINGTPGEYSHIGSGYCGTHTGETPGTTIKVNSL